MADNSFGQLFSFTTFGESHGPGIGCVVDGVPPRIPSIGGAANTEISRVFNPDANQRFQTRMVFVDALGAPNSWLNRFFLLGKTRADFGVNLASSGC